MEKGQMKQALIFDPYLDTLGGGERYALTFALTLAHLGYSVKIAWKDTGELVEAGRRFGLDTSDLSLDQEGFRICSGHASFMEKFNYTRQFDLIFWVSDGSLPFLFAKTNLIHFQVPFTAIGGNPLINGFKLGSVKRIVYNSNFTRNIVERNLLHMKGFVLYPPIDTAQFKVGKKDKLILSVARFASPSHSKRQDILVDAFRQLSSKTKDYTLILAGGQRGDTTQLKELEKQAKGLRVEIIANPEFDQLCQLYSKAEFFWHAAGFGIDETKEPEKVEHFGMSTVEAMSAGCVPVVIAKGGQKEIITPESGVLVDTPEEMASSTLSLINDQDKRKHLSASAITRAEDFSLEVFSKQVRKLLQ